MMATDQIVQENNNPYNCNECGKTFVNKWNLKQHRLIHTGEKPFICRECGRGFSRSDTLNKHRKIHTKTYKCNTCQESFSKFENLRLHIRTHKAEKPFCNICGRSFTHRSNLLKHQVTHTQNRPFQCNICGKAFIQNKHLKTHQLIHMGERTFKCDVCGKAFIQTNHLKTHHKIHTGERPYICKECDKSFVQRVHLRRHVERIHMKKLSPESTFFVKHFSSPSDFQQHTAVNVQTTERSGTCDVFEEACHTDVVELNPFQTQSQSHSNEDSVQMKNHQTQHCKECGQVSNSMEHLCEHYSNCHGLPVVRLERL